MLPVENLMSLKSCDMQHSNSIYAIFVMSVYQSKQPFCWPLEHLMDYVAICDMISVQLSFLLRIIYHWKAVICSILTVRRFLLMPDVGRGDEVRDEKRSDSLEYSPRVVWARWGESNCDRDEPRIDWRTPSWELGVRTIQLFIHLARGHIGLCYRTNSQSTANLVQWLTVMES